MGTLSIEVTANDGQSTVASTFNLTVTNTNDAPELSLALADQSGNENAALSFTLPAGSFTDVDAGDSLSYAATLSDGSALPAWLSFDAATQTFSGTPAASAIGTLSILVAATDESGATVSDVFDVTINNVNDAPTIDQGLSDATTAEDAVLSIAIPTEAFSDIDGDVLSYTATLSDGSALPSWLSFDGVNFTGTPTNDELGKLTIEVTANDGHSTVASTFNLTVTNTNDAPVLSLALVGQSGNENTALSFTLPAGSFTDVDAGDSLSYTATLSDGSVLPSWLSFDAATQTFSGTPAASAIGTLSVLVAATDNHGASAASVFTIEVADSFGGITGTDGDDLLIGSSGNDFFQAGSGNDELHGGAGDDSYYYMAGDGVNTIDNSGGGDDVIILEGIATSSLSFHRDGDDLIVLVDSDLGQQIKVLNHFLGGDFAISEVVNNDTGESATAEMLATLLVALPDSFGGITGTDGDDLLIGSSGNDFFQAGSGNDELHGGAGDDSYYYMAGDGVNTIDNSGGGDDVIILEGIATSSLSFHRDGDDLIVLVDSDLGQQIKVLNHFLGGDFAISEVVNNDTGESATAEMLATLLVALPGELNDAPTVGQRFSDTGDVTFDIQSLVDEPISITGSGSAEVFEGGNSGDYINAKGGVDKLYGFDGNDTLIGGGGSDQLYGGSGDDILVGGEGDDTYHFAQGDDYDNINNASDEYATETDVLSLEGLISEEDVWFQKINNHLDVYLLGSDDHVRVNNWYKADKYKLDRIETGSSSIDSAGIEQLVNAMATFGGFSGSENLTSEEQQQVSVAIAAAWA